MEDLGDFSIHLENLLAVPGSFRFAQETDECADAGAKKERIALDDPG
jgi:hypothetical protein